MVKNRTRWPVVGAVMAAVAASICCVGPILLLALGVGGAWVANLSALEPYRPLFMLIALAFLGFGFYRVFRKPGKEACEEGSLCANPKAGRASKIALIVATVLVIGLFAYPYIAASLASCCVAPEQSSGPTEQVVLNVEGMTCAGCVATVTRSLTKLDGVQGARVTLDPPRAVVTYDPTKLAAVDLTEATTRAGYLSRAAGEEP